MYHSLENFDLIVFGDIYLAYYPFVSCSSRMNHDPRKQSMGRAKKVPTMTLQQSVTVISPNLSASSFTQSCVSMVVSIRSLFRDEMLFLALNFTQDLYKMERAQIFMQT